MRLHLADVHGNSATATKLQTARTIALSGDVTGSASFDGSKNMTINADLSNVAILTGTITVTNGEGKTNVNYPTGYNNSNCVVIAAGVSNGTTTSGIYIFGTASKRTTGAMLYQNYIKLSTASLDNVGPTGSLNYKIMLMKI